jgi:rhamnosyltransferase
MELSSLAAIVVCFYPDAEKLSRLVTRISPSVRLVILFDNGGLDINCLPKVEVEIHVESRRVNVGVATALNQACQVAVQRGMHYAVSFDQDSLPAPEMIEVLMSEMRLARSDGIRVAAIGPQIRDVRDGKMWHSAFARTAGWIPEKWHGSGTEEVSLLLTSGCLFDLTAWQTIPFDDQLFIDYVDHNWCWRLAKHGYKVLGTTKTFLMHELSDGLRSFGKRALGRYSPIRRYFQFRNAVYHLLYFPMPLGGKLFVMRNIISMLASVIFLDNSCGLSLKQSMRGVMHGVCKSFGLHLLV